MTGQGKKVRVGARGCVALLATAAVVSACSGAAAQAAPVSESFRSPSGGIQCHHTDIGLVCKVATPGHARHPNGVEAHIKARYVDVYAVDDWVHPRPRKVLGYGERYTHGKITCVMRTTGLTCRNATGRGFHLSRASQRELRPR